MLIYGVDYFTFHDVLEIIKHPKKAKLIKNLNNKS
jgi:hypothetical protein